MVSQSESVFSSGKVDDLLGIWERKILRRNQTWILRNVVYRTNDCVTTTLYYYCLCESYNKFVNGEYGDGSPPHLIKLLYLKLSYILLLKNRFIHIHTHARTHAHTHIFKPINKIVVYINYDIIFQKIIAHIIHYIYNIIYYIMY